MPGLIITQHSGEGKANQYFLRGFNLDHGTDLAISVDGMPVNMRTHGHGQGYADINFLIPELIKSVRVRKGPYFADEGDFSSAGAIHIDYRRQPDRKASTQSTVGSFGYRRLLAAKSLDVGAGKLLGAFEANTYDGPWVVPDEVRKFNGLLRYSQGDAGNGFSILGLALSKPGTRPTRSRCAQSKTRRSTASARSIRPTAAIPAATACPAAGREAKAKCRTQAEAYPHPPDHDAVQQLHLLPRRSGERRPVQPVRPAHHRRRQREPHDPGPSSARSTPRTRSASSSAATTSRSAC